MQLSEAASEQPTLHNQLFSLVNEMFARASELSRSLPKVPMKYVRKRVSAFTATKGHQSANFFFEDQVRDTIPIPEFDAAFRNIIQSLPEYSACRHLLTAYYGPALSFALKHFLRRLLYRYVEEPAEDTRIDDLLAFVAHLENSPIDWHLSVWLTGVFLTTPTIDLGNGAVLRQIKASDLESEQCVDHAAMGMVESTFTGLSQPTAILDLRTRASAPVSAQNRLESILAVLRLFRLGSVKHLKYAVRARTFWRMSGYTIGGSEFGGPESYELGVNDTETLRTFFCAIYPTIPDGFSVEDTCDPLAIALRRYSDAHFARGPIEGKIASTVACLEALYLKGHERSELTHRLSQRAAATLGFNGYHAIKAYKNLVRAYEIRSSFVHGGALESSEQEGAHKLWKEMLDYARISLAVFLQLPSHKEKDQFLSRIENAFLDDSARQKLRAEILGMQLPWRAAVQAVAPSPE